MFRSHLEKVFPDENAKQRLLSLKGEQAENMLCLLQMVGVFHLACSQRFNSCSGSRISKSRAISDAEQCDYSRSYQLRAASCL
jgi:hypothetical protein